MISSVVLDSRRTCKKTSVELLLHNKALQHQVASNNNEKKKAKKNIIVAHSLETVQFGPPTAEWFFQPGPDSVNIGWALLYLGSAAELPGSWLVPHRLAEMAYLCSMWCLFLQQANLSLMGWWQQPRSQEQQEEKPQCTGTFQVKSRHVAMPTVVQEGIIKCLDTGGGSKCGRHHHQSTNSQGSLFGDQSTKQVSHQLSSSDLQTSTNSNTIWGATALVGFFWNLLETKLGRK